MISGRIYRDIIVDESSYNRVIIGGSGTGDDEKEGTHEVVGQADGVAGRADGVGNASPV